MGVKAKEAQAARNEAAVLSTQLVAVQIEVEEERKRNKELSIGQNQQDNEVHGLETDLSHLKNSLPLRD